MAFKLPKTIRLPYAPAIRVVELPGKDERMVGCDGLWDDDERTIYIRRGLTNARKKVLLYHELLHAVHDLAWKLEW